MAINRWFHKTSSKKQELVKLVRKTAVKIAHIIHILTQAYIMTTLLHRYVIQHSQHRLKTHIQKKCWQIKAAPAFGMNCIICFPSIFSCALRYWQLWKAQSSARPCVPPEPSAVKRKSPRHPWDLGRHFAAPPVCPVPERTTEGRLYTKSNTHIT